ncbi:MAG: DUF488 domain-containing protein [Bacteroidia bacterium]
MEKMKTIWTIGHSTHPIIEFIEMLQSFKIEMLADIRSYPSSRFCPQFNESALQKSLAEAAIDYQHMPGLGGRRKPKLNSKNTIWRNAGFRGYADYMETNAFKDAIKELEEIALKKPTVYMCSEAFYLKCHRSMVSDYLKSMDWKVMHIMRINKFVEHDYTKPARTEKGRLIYV